MASSATTVASVSEATKDTPGSSAAADDRRSAELFDEGVAALNRGDNAEAEAALSKAAALTPQHGAIWSNLGVAQSNLAKLSEAVCSFEHAVAAQPGYPAFLFNLGHCLRLNGALGRAEEIARQSIALAPTLIQGHINLATALRDQGRYQEAELACLDAIRVKPDEVEPHQLLGWLCAARRDYDRAEEHYMRGLSLDPRHLHCRFERAELYRQRGDYGRARGLFQELVDEFPDLSLPRAFVGISLRALGRLQESLVELEKAASLEPGNGQILANFAAALIEASAHDLAESVARKAVAAQPNLAEANFVLGAALCARGKPEEGLAAFRKTLSIDPGNIDSLSNIIFLSDLVCGRDEGVRQRRAYGDWMRTHVPARTDHTRDRDPDRPLRVGYVSGDFKYHSASAIFAPIIFGHRRQNVHVWMYSGVVHPDEMTRKFFLAGEYVETADLSDEALVERIEADKIDILVDLSGHTSGTKLRVFGRKPAPIQATGWGHALGTGMDTMDYFFGDAVSVPPEEESDFVEQVLHLPSLICFTPPPLDVGISLLPALTRQTFTFGCLNRFEKISNHAARLWAEILRQEPDARLLLKSGGIAPERWRESRLGALFRDVPDRQIEVRGGSGRAEHLRAYSDVDLSLDPFPHGGGTSSLESFWMGVPLLARVGRGIVERQGAAFNLALGLGEFVAQSDDAYVARALAWMHRRQELATIRAGLRVRLMRSPIADAALHVRTVEGHYRSMWHRWLAKTARQ